MRSIIFFAFLAHATFAVLENRAHYGDTILEYYDHYDDSINMAGAIARCWQRGGWLVMPKYSSLDSAVGELTSGAPVWIGLGDFAIENAFEFIDGSRMTWVNWRSGEPNNYEDNENCVESYGGGWNDQDCNDLLGYVCQIPNTRKLAYDYSHFKVYKGVNKTTYGLAAASCARFGRRLVKVKDNHYVHMLIKKMSQLAGMGFWASTDDVIEEGCSSVSANGLSMESCDTIKPYTCEAVEPHKLIVSEQEPKVAMHSDLQIHCSAYGYPVPEVTWFRNGIEVGEQAKKNGKSTLELHDVTTTDGGPYVCRATNKINHREYKMEGYSIVTVIDETGE